MRVITASGEQGVKAVFSITLMTAMQACHSSPSSPENERPWRIMGRSAEHPLGAVSTVPLTCVDSCANGALSGDGDDIKSPDRWSATALKAFVLAAAPWQASAAAYCIVLTTLGLHRAVACLDGTGAGRRGGSGVTKATCEHLNTLA